MNLPRRKFREIVFLIIHSEEHVPAEEELLALVMRQLKVSKKNVKMAFKYSRELMAKLPQIDEEIKKVSSNYRFDRISKVELAVLRLGVFELMFMEEIPEKVAIAEAIRLCRKFGSRESAKFVNALLDSVMKNNENKK